jgi:hypothetical protein
MSKLADAIRRSQRVESTPLGFGAARPAPKASMLVGFFGSASDAAKARDAEADFLLIDARNGGIDAARLRGLAGDLPLGAWTHAADSAAAKTLREAGLDFLIVDTDSPAAAMLDDDLGYVLALPAQPDEIFLRSLEPLGLEALLLAEVSSPLTVAGQIDLSRSAALARRPMLYDLRDVASADDLLCLRAAGVVGVMTGAAGLADLKAAVAALPPRRSRREERAVVALPRGQVAAEVDDDDDDRSA